MISFLVLSHTGTYGKRICLKNDPCPLSVFNIHEQVCATGSANGCPYYLIHLFLSPLVLLSVWLFSLWPTSPIVTLSPISTNFGPTGFLAGFCFAFQEYCWVNEKAVLGPVQTPYLSCAVPNTFSLLSRIKWEALSYPEILARLIEICWKTHLDTVQLRKNYVLLGTAHER